MPYEEQVLVINWHPTQLGPGEQLGIWGLIYMF